MRCPECIQDNFRKQSRGAFKLVNLKYEHKSGWNFLSKSKSPKPKPLKVLQYIYIYTFRTKSTWNPPQGHPALEMFLSQMEADVFSLLPGNTTQYNLSKEEWKRKNI